MNPDKDDIVKASNQIGLTDSQVDNLWKAFQELQVKKPKSSVSTALLYLGAIIAILSMTWFYTANFNNNYTLLISITYSLIFFGAGSYFWRVKKLRVPGSFLSLLGIVMVPLIVYSLQNVMHWWPISNRYVGFYHWIQGDWVPMEICTLAIAFLTLYFIRVPLISVPIYLTLSFMTMDAIYLITNPYNDNWAYYSNALIILGTLFNVLGFVLCRKDQKEFGFWSYLFGMFFGWTGLTSLNLQTEWGYFIYFLINAMFILISNYFHRKIFMFFGFLGVIHYLGYLSIRFYSSVMFSYILAMIGFGIILLATVLMRLRKKRQVS